MGDSNYTKELVTRNEKYSRNRVFILAGARGIELSRIISSGVVLMLKHILK